MVFLRIVMISYEQFQDLQQVSSEKKYVSQFKHGCGHKQSLTCRSYSKCSLLVLHTGSKRDDMTRCWFHPPASSCYTGLPKGQAGGKRDFNFHTQNSIFFRSRQKRCTLVGIAWAEIQQKTDQFSEIQV